MNSYISKPSDETLEQGRNRAHGVLVSPNPQVYCFSHKLYERSNIQTNADRLSMISIKIRRRLG